MFICLDKERNEYFTEGTFSEDRFLRPSPPTCSVSISKINVTVSMVSSPVGWHDLCITAFGDLPEGSETSTSCFQAWCSLWTDLAVDAPCSPQTVDWNMACFCCWGNKAAERKLWHQGSCQNISKGCSNGIPSVTPIEPYRYFDIWEQTSDMMCSCCAKIH